MSDNFSSSQLWERLTGDPESFSMENRAFNYVSVVSFAVILYCLAFDIYFGQVMMSAVLISLFFVQCGLYYFSRFKRNFRTGTIIYAVCSYFAICANYYLNSGISGPTLFLFFMVFQFLVAISGRVLNMIWVALHLLIPLVLLGTEYVHPEWVPDTYNSKTAHFTDIYTTYVAVLVFVLLVTGYLRRYYIREKNLANERALAIQLQNEQIIEQNKQLARINEEKNKLFSIVSHDLKGPVDSVSGYLELLSQDLITVDERREIERELHHQTKYTSDLLLNLLYWSKTQMNGVNVVLRPLPLRTMVDDARNYKIAFAAKKGIKLTYSIDKNMEVIADEEMMRIVLRNLVNNAIKFTQPGGEIFITVANKDHTAIVSIKDTGIGIPAEKQKEIFTLKTNSTYGTRDEKGIGLGLMLCKEFMEYMHGNIWFESEPGKGSVFHVSLPLSRL